MDTKVLVCEDHSTFCGLDGSFVAEIPDSPNVEDDDIEQALKTGEWEDTGETASLPVRRLVALPKGFGGEAES